jgi:hypothetical protein
MLVNILLRLSLSVVYLSSIALAGVNKVFTDATFEHDTQAATGQTTGVWLVRFCEPTAMSNWCVDGFIEYWADLCDEVFWEQDIMTGSVDLAKNAGLAKRFSSPILEKHGVQLALFKEHGMYLTNVVHEGDRDMTREEVMKWVLEGHASEAKLAVPPEPALLDAVWVKLDEAEKIVRETVERVVARVVERIPGDFEVRTAAGMALGVVVSAVVGVVAVVALKKKKVPSKKSKAKKT